MTSKFVQKKCASSILPNLQTFLEERCAEFNVPALSVAVWYNNQLYQAATGILNLDTGVEATTDSIFQIGSISKLFTASLIMQLVDEGKVNLEAPVKNTYGIFRWQTQK